MTGRMTCVIPVLSVVLSSCVTPEFEQYSARGAGFDTVSTATSAATNGKRAVWIQDQAQAEQVAVDVRALLEKKTIDVDTAVQIALLNNRGLQAAYADIGISAVEVWQQALPENPKVSIGLLGIASPELGLFRALESMIATNVLSLATRDRRVAAADTRFRQAQSLAVEETLRVAGQARRAWIESVASFEKVFYLNQARQAADAASELAQRLGETGFLAKAVTCSPETSAL